MKTNPLTISRRVIGDREPIAHQLCDNKGAPLDLTGKTIVFRLVALSDGAVIVDDAAATIDEAATGKVSYTPAAEDVDTAGAYAAYFLDTTSSPPRRFPYDAARLQIHIYAENDNAAP